MGLFPKMTKISITRHESFSGYSVTQFEACGDYGLFVDGVGFRYIEHEYNPGFLKRYYCKKIGDKIETVTTFTKEDTHFIKNIKDVFKVDIPITV